MKSSEGLKLKLKLASALSCKTASEISSNSLSELLESQMRLAFGIVLVEERSV